MKVLKSIKILLLLCYLFSFVLSDYAEGKKLTFSDKETYNGEGTKFYDINFGESFGILDTYLQIKINALKNNQMVLLSEKEQCFDNRIAFSNQQYGPINLFIKKNQIPRQNRHLFLCVKCLNKESCEYKIEFYSSESCELDLGEQTSYYVDSNNEEMEFTFKGIEINNEGEKANIWVKGQNIVSTFLKSEGGAKIQQVSFGFGDIYIANLINKIPFTLTVKSKIGDFVTVGSLLIEKRISKTLEVNDLEIMGMLNNELRQICFPIKQYEETEDQFAQINGIIYTKKAKTFFSLDGNHEYETHIKDGLIYEHVYVAGEMEPERKFCVEYLDEDRSNEVIFSLQFTSNVYRINNPYIYAPQLPGVIYSHYLPRGAMTVFRGMKPKNGAKEMNFNMKAIKGFPDMYFHRAKDFPETVYDPTKLDETFDNPHHSNRITVYNFYLNETDYTDYTPLSNNQPIIVVYCAEGTNKTDVKEIETEFCEFETSIFSDLDRINLIEKDTLSQYLFPGEVDLYTINIEEEKDLAKVYLDLIIFSGDVDFEIETESISQNAHKYFLSNKIFYSISINEGDKVIDFKVTAQQKSFYLIQYQLVRKGDESKNINKIESGVNYIQSIFIGEGADYMKYVDFENLNYELLSPFLINFYSENCQFIVSRLKKNQKEDETYEEEYFVMEDNYGQIIIDESDEYFDDEKYRFRIDITGDDASEYNKKLCMFYISGLELSNKNDISERTISVSEGVPQRFIFTNKYNSIKYSYHISDINKPVIINFNLIDKGIYNVTLLHNNIKIKNETIYRNRQILVYNSELKEICKNDEVCTINIYIALLNNEESKRFEITMYQVNGAPIYLAKNVVKQDILIGSLRKYYYFDIGYNETGDINIDYIRGSGYIYASIVSKTSYEKLPNPDWRGIYQFPKDKKKTLSYETYLKKIPIIEGYTQKCQDGCYVLITVESSLYNETQQFNEKDEFTPYRITITPRVYPKDVQTPEFISEYLIPRVRMSVNHFVLGNVFKTRDKILTYYQVQLPYDSDYVIFDWQADKPHLYINVGEERPGIRREEHDFSINSGGHDTVYRLSKNDIIEKARNKTGEWNFDTLQNYTLTLGIWTHQLDTIYTSMYAFKIFMPKLYKENEGIPRKIYEIVHIRSDQKVQCEPNKEGNTYSCVFAVIFDDCDVGKNLVVYPKAQKENLEVTFFGYKVNAEEIEKNNMKFINEKLQSNKKDYSTENKDKFIFYEKIEKNICILFEVKTTEFSNIEVLSSTYLIKEDSSLIINPSTPNIFSIGDKKCYFKFETSQDLLINIVSISGDGYFIWEKEEQKDIRYILSGFEDRLTLTSGTSEKENQLSRLVAQSTTFTIFEKDESGFVFYVSFYPRNHYANIDQVKIGRSTEFNYREVSFPLNFYTKLTDNDLAISFTFYNYYLDKEYKLEYDKNAFDIWGIVISEEKALEIRMREDLRPQKNSSSIYGSFDGSFGTLFLNPEDINSFNVSERQRPYLFFSIEPKFESSLYFNGLSMEVSISNENDRNYFAPEYVYLNGKLSNKNTITQNFIYKLRTDSLNPFMAVEFSSNGNLVKWEVSTTENIRNKLTDKKVYLNGRYIMTFQVPNHVLESKSPLYLIVYTDETTINPKLSNYVFKYMNGKSVDSFFVFEQEKDLVDYNITMKNGKKSYTITFYPVEQFDVNYYVKGVYKGSRIYDEVKDTIAISESPGYYLQVDNPDFEIEKQIKFVLDNVPNDLAYIKILAKVNFYNIKEYLLYKPIDIYEEDEPIPDVDFENLEPTQLVERVYEKTKRTIKLNFNEALKLQIYKIQFKNNDEIPNYIKIQVNSKDELINKNLYFSPDGPTGKREQLAQSGVSKSVIMWIKREQLKTTSLYTTLECQILNDKKCSYSIQITGYNYTIIDSYIFNYNYYVSEYNKEMKFRINNDLGIERTKDQILTLYANGGKKIKLFLSNCIDNSCKQYNFRTGAAITTQIQSHNYFELTIQAEVGDYLSVGSKVTENNGKPLEVNGETINNVLQPNGNQYTGYLKKYILENECYLISHNYGQLSYIVAIFYNKVAQISFKDLYFKDVGEKEINEKGYYTYVHDSTNLQEYQKRYICIGFPDYSYNYIKEDLAYTIQLTQPKEQIGLPNFYTPQLSGNIYPRIIPKGSAVIFNGANLNTNSENIIYNMIAVEGLPKMYMYKCSNYPLCDVFTIDEEERENIIEVNEINRMATWHNVNPDKENSPIDAEQYIMVVFCTNFNNSLTDVCQFQTSIYGNRDEIYLLEKQSFSQYLLKDDKAKYVIELTNDNSITKVHVDIYVLSGDVNFNLKNELNNDITSHKYYLANKIFYSVNLEQNVGINKIYAEVEAKVNSYYAIEYKFVKESGGELTNDIYSGINYLIPISPSKGANSKVINIHNVKLLVDNFYFASFYSLNCNFKVTKLIDREEQEITSFVNYAQDIIHNEDEKDIDIHSYVVTVVENDISRYKNNMCMLLVSGLEITQEKDSIAQKDILISDGVPQRTVFQHKLNKIKYIYPNPDKNKNIAVYFKVINPAEYYYIITFNHYDKNRDTIYQSKILFLSELSVNDHCKENELCNIIIEVFVKQEIGDLVPILEVTVKQINNNPYYIPKGIVKQDFVSANSSLYLYTTLGQDDEGYITVDFARGSGLVYAKIVEIDGNGDANPEWRQYQFPQNQKDSLYYEFYNKRIVFTNDKTEKCGKGCYLLINLQPSVKGKFEEKYRFFPFSITVSLTPNGNLTQIGSIIQIEPEEYVVSSLSKKEKIKNKEMYEFYQITIPYDADKVEFDWQSDTAIFLVKVGDERPTLPNNYNFIFNTSRSDSIFELTNQQIKDKLVAGNTIRDAFLTIGVYTDDYESQFGTAYSFRVHFSQQKLNIYRINSDQKTLCKPHSIGNNEYRCLFMITYSDLDFINDLMVYAKSQSLSASTNMYGKFINKKIYDSLNYEELEKNIPNENSTFNTKKEEVDFLFLTLSELFNHFYISVISDKPDIIEFITSFKTFDTELSPNPSSVQLFSINNDKSMKLKFKTTKGIIINIVSLFGSSKIYIEDEPNVEYSLRGRDDGLSLAIPANEKETILIVEDRNYKQIQNQMRLLQQKDKMTLPSLAFYIEYHLRSIDLNFDEIYLGKTAEFIYQKSDFPLYYYSKLNDFNYNVNTFFILHDLEYEKVFNEIKSEDIEIRGIIIKEKTVYLIKVKEESKPNIDNSPIIGSYDPALQVGQLVFTSESIQNFNIKKEEKPTIYLSFEKKTDYKFKKIRMELTSVQENSNSTVTEKIYQYGKLYDDKTINSHKLKVDNSTGDMRIQFSSNNKNIDFAINTANDKKVNITNLGNKQTKRENGIVYITFNKPTDTKYLYLNVFLKGAVKNKNNNNYVFKYINADNRNKFFEYKINGNANLNVKEANDLLEVKFNTINSKNVDIIYSLKGILSNDYISNENFDTIALTQSKSTVNKTKNPDKNEITLSLKKDTYRYVQVIAQIRDGPITEYVAYNRYSFIKEEDNENNTNNKTSKTSLYVVIGISVGLLIIVIILVIVIFSYNAKNKDLMDQVNKISFVSSGAKPKDDTNLLLDNQNELD